MDRVGEETVALVDGAHEVPRRIKEEHARIVCRHPYLPLTVAPDAVGHLVAHLPAQQPMLGYFSVLQPIHPVHCACPYRTVFVAVEADGVHRSAFVGGHFLDGSRELVKPEQPFVCCEQQVAFVLHLYRQHVALVDAFMPKPMFGHGAVRFYAYHHSLASKPAHVGCVAADAPCLLSRHDIEQLPHLADEIQAAAVAAQPHVAAGVAVGCHDVVVV